MKMLLAILLIAGFAFAWNGTSHMRDLNSTLSMIECRTNTTIGLLDNQSNLTAYAAALQKDEASLAGFAAAGDAKSFFGYLRASYIPDLKAAFKALRENLGRGGARHAMAGCMPAKGQMVRHFGRMPSHARRFMRGA